MDSIEQIRDKVLVEIHRLEILEKEDSKEVYRSLHAPAVEMALNRNQEWIKANYNKYSSFFASGEDITPSAISPILIEVVQQWHYDLFRLARLTWSLPFTVGYGRRLRYLLIDKSNQKLIGILGMQSPPLDFPVRDKLFNYPKNRKVELVNQTMDIFTLGAVPPYNRLLGGKLVALAATSNEVQKAYVKKYKGKTTLIEQVKLPARLVALTTTSAFGRSSIYNRLTFQGKPIAQSIGYTEGYGSFHLATLYPLLCEFLEQQGVSTKGGFGVGPRIVWQNCVRAFSHLDLPKSLLKHGIKREAFLFPLITNLKDYMGGHTKRPIYYDRAFEELAKWWRERWLLPRSERVDGWHAWDSDEIEDILMMRKRVDDVNSLS